MDREDCPVDCQGCKHDDWIKAWQLKERRREELFNNVKANIITWACVCTLGYLAVLALNAFKQYLKS